MKNKLANIGLIHHVEAAQKMGYKNWRIARDYGLSEEEVRVILGQQSKRETVEAKRSVAIRLMKETERIKPPSKRQRQQRAVMGNFCDVVPEWSAG